MTADPALAQHLAGLAATAGVALVHRPRVQGGWPSPAEVPLILADPDAELPGERRAGVVLVCAGEPGAGVWQRGVEVGAEQVAVLPDAEAWVLDRLVDAASPGPGAPVIGVVGGSGGAGASTLATAVATVAAGSGVPTALIDADPLGGGLDLLLGVEHEAGLRWPDLLSARGRLQPGLLAATLPELDGLWVLSWDRGLPDSVPVPAGTTPLRVPATVPAPARGAMPVPLPPVPVPEEGGALLGSRRGPTDPRQEPTDPRRELPAAAVEAVLHAATREFGLVVVDLSRHLSAGDLAAAAACRLVLVVVPAQVRATAAAGRVTAALEHAVVDQRLVVRGPAPAGLAADAVADALGLPLAGELRREAAVAAALDRGEPFVRPRGSLSVLANRVLAEVRR